MKAWLACVRKELLLQSRDLHGLALLFLMPMAFVLIMSLALQNQFAERGGAQLKVLTQDLDKTPASNALLANLADAKGFQFVVSDTTLTRQQIETALRQGRYAFALQLEHGLADSLLAQPATTQALIRLTVAPDTGKQTQSLFVASLHAVLGGARLQLLLQNIGVDAAATTGHNNDIAVDYAYRQHGVEKTPSAVQQSVPAWLVFGAFFVVIPLSNTFIRERQQGMLRRLRTYNLSNVTLLLGKLAPYFAINLIQVALMLLVGRYLVPMLGGEALMLSGSLLLLFLMSCSLSIAALGLALLIAVSARTTEQATLLGGTGNILLAALGGIMVPKFIMPEAMQQIAAWSPMSWGLDGFLDILLRAGTLTDIAPEALRLTLFGLTAILLAWFMQSRRMD